jgi:electron transfer flavoprotein alpha subunit
MAETYIYSEKEEKYREIIVLVQSRGVKATLLALGEELTDAQRNSGADKLVWLKNDNDRPEDYALSIAELLKSGEAQAFLTDTSTRCRELAAHVAGLLDAPMLSDVLSLDLSAEGLQAERIIYGGLMNRKTSIEGFAVATVTTGQSDLKSANVAVASIVEQIVDVTDSRITVQRKEKIEKTGVDLDAAKAIICAGLGIKEKDDLLKLEELAQSSNGAVACTRGVAEDRVWLPADTYIGISGRVLNPDLYLGIAVSGQVQHVYGIRGAKTIAAINTDENAPIARVSDYILIADYREALPLLKAALDS